MQIRLPSYQSYALSITIIPTTFPYPSSMDSKFSRMDTNKRGEHTRTIEMSTGLF